MSFSFDPDLIEMPIGHHIGGAFVAAQGEVPIHRPSDNVAFAECPVTDVDVVDRAVQAAKAALHQSQWGGCQPRDRTRALQRWATFVVGRVAAPAARCTGRWGMVHCDPKRPASCSAMADLAAAPGFARGAADSRAMACRNFRSV